MNRLLSGAILVLVLFVIGMLLRAALTNKQEDTYAPPVHVSNPGDIAKAIAEYVPNVGANSVNNSSQQSGNDNAGQQANNSSSNNQVATFQWATGDVYGEPDTCHMMISDADGSLALPSTHGTVAQGSFRAASLQSYNAQVEKIRSDAARDSVSKQCDIVSQPSNLPFN